MAAARNKTTQNTDRAALWAALMTWAVVVSPTTAFAQPTDFQIVWVLIGEAASPDSGGSVRAGRQLFRASDLMPRTLANVKVARVDVGPVVTEVIVGEQLCLSSLDIRVFGPDQKPILGAPLSIAIRQDHKERLRLKRSRRDICLRPSAAGEYPVRLTSLLPAPDSTMRGAQVFLRAKDKSGVAPPTE